MSGAEIASHITAAMQGIGFCIQAYDTIRDTSELPIAFQAVSEGLPLAHNTLTLATEQATTSNASSQDVEVIRSTMDATRKKTRELENIMRKIRRVEEAIDRLAAMEPSYPDERPVNSRDRFHAGVDINANTDNGVYYNLKGNSRIGSVGNGGRVKYIYHGTGPGALVTGSDSDSD